ncbi:MAG: flagellar filament capping protein FliD [Solirubrobacteraceae bacterium]
MSSLSVNSSGSSPISVTGLASGLDTSAIIQALLAAEKQPIERLAARQEKLAGQEAIFQGIQSSLQQLEFAVSDFSLSSLYETSQTVTSSEPLRITATTTAGAGVGGYEVEVTQLANSAQRTFAFASPAAEDTLSIDGHEYTLKAGATAKELANKINSDSTATVYAAVVNNETVVLSSRATGVTGGEFITVSDPGGALTEKEGSAKAGKNAEFTVDGVAATSTSNVVTTAIAGVTLTLDGLTTTGPVTIDVQPPGLNTSALEAKVQAFMSLYNSTVETIQKQLTTKPPVSPNTAEATGSLFGDRELTSLLYRMRQTMYEPIAGLAAEMSSPSSIGLTTGAVTGTSSQSSLEGKLTLESSKFASALASNPAGVKTMLQKWSQGLQGIVLQAAEPGGTVASRITADSTEVGQLKRRIATMNEMLAVRQKALEQTYAELEAIISKNSALGSWLTSQSEQLNKSSH